MSKKIIIITSVVLTIFLVCLLAFYFITKNGSTRTEGVVSTFKNFFPFGGSDTPNNATSTENNQSRNNNSGENQNNSQEFIKKLRKLSEEPVSGAGTFDTKAGTLVRYVEKATGHIFETELFSPKVSRISNTTIPLSYDAIWGNKNNSFMARYLNDDDQTVTTYALTINNSSTSTENITSSVRFIGDISDISVMGNSVFYLVENPDSSYGFVSSFDGKNKKMIWESDIRELLSQYVNDKTVVLFTKPAENIMGYLYSVDTTNGGTRRILEGVAGLSAKVNADASKVLYAEQAGAILMTAIDTKTLTSNKIFPPTFPYDKCVWSKLNRDVVYCAVPKEYINGASMTSWYKGETTYNDSIWQYNTKDATSGKLIDLSEESGEKIDVIKPILSENETYLVFMNKKDNTLWSLDLGKTATGTSSTR